MKIGWIIGLGVLASSLNLSIAARVFADGGDTTLVHGCVNNNTKATRIVGANVNCQNNETTRHWPTAARIVADETRITNTENKNTTQDSAISTIQTKNNQQDADIAALQGQVGGGGASAVVVKDSLGQSFGRLVDQTTAFLKIDNIPFFLQVNAVGFTAGGGGFYFHHTTADCSGTRYLLSFRSSGQLTEATNSIDGQIVYYASERTQALLIQSLEFVSSPQELAGMGQCTQITPDVITVAIPATVNLSTLGTPPFHIE